MTLQFRNHLEEVNVISFPFRCDLYVRQKVFMNNKRNRLTSVCRRLFPIQLAYLCAEERSFVKFVNVCKVSGNVRSFGV